MGPLFLLKFRRPKAANPERITSVGLKMVANKMTINLNMFRALMKNQIVGNLNKEAWKGEE